MRTLNWRIAVGGVLIPGVLMVSYACQNQHLTPETSHNLKYVQCNPQGFVDVEVKKDSGVAPINEYIFVCAGDKVRWFTDDDNFSFTINFNDLADPKDLFESGSSHFPSKPDTEAEPTKRHKRVSEVQKVSKNAKHYKDYPYDADKSGNIVSSNDPHIIPM